jgi:c-di-GMP-binding flagellar brake protein YcgR
MSTTSVPTAHAREYPRLKLPAMYTLIRVRPEGQERYCWTGYIYDISASGMRFELDAALEAGTHVEVRAMLPGSQQVTIQASGTVVRQHDDADERGPIRMGLKFERFVRHADRTRLIDYIERSALKAA